MSHSPIILSLCNRLRADFGLSPVLATEIEFYLHGSGECGDFPAFEAAMAAHSAEEGIAASPLVKERGVEQYELSLSPLADADCIARQTKRLKAILAECADAHAMQADFTAKPFADQPGSGLHVHLHLEDAGGRNVFLKQNEEYSAPLRHAVGGLLATMAEAMVFFAPFPESYARFAGGQEVPTNVSWGPNNRTVAIRLPTKMPGEAARHLEHRVAGADADPEAVLAAILAGAHYGLTEKIAPREPIFGNAFLPSYGLTALPSCLEEAIACRKSAILRDYLTKEG